MQHEIIATSFEDAQKLATASYWVESFYFADTDQGEAAEENFNRAYQLTERNESDLVHYSKVT
jgi:hypothetical protein